MYIEQLEKTHIKNKSQVSKTMFLAKYGSLDLYDEDLEKSFIIYYEQLEFDITDGWTLIGITDKEDGTLSDHEYFCIHDDLFDRIKSTHQDQNFLWKFSYNEITEDESQSEAIETQNDKIQNKKRSATKYSKKHTLQRKRQKPVDYRDNSLDGFRLIIVDPHPKLHIDDLVIPFKCNVPGMKKETNEDIAKMILTHLLKRWDQDKTK